MKQVSNLVKGIIFSAMLLIVATAMWPVISTQITAFTALNITGGTLISSTILGILFVAGLAFGIYKAVSGGAVKL